MSMLYRTRLNVRFGLPMYPFTPSAVHEYGELRLQPGHGRVQYVDPGKGHIPIPFNGGPRWRTSRADGLRAAIIEAEEAAGAIAALLDQLRQELLQESANQRHAIAHERPHQPQSPAGTESGTSSAVEAATASRQ